MDSITIRKKFVEFFVSHGHTHVASSSLIPAEDPTLLFANAGMNQFKDIFLGREMRSYTRAVSVQKCVRGTDLENVGFTKRHLTFFEMLGNFSFGDYFKEGAITFAWDFLVNHLHLDSNKLYASVYKNDDEAFTLWQTKIGLPASKIVRLGESDNFWQMGETGPCGPCSEIYIDRGTKFGCGTSQCAPGCSCDRFLEIWNLVFMQFDRQMDGSLKPLTRKGVDTGMGLERIAAVIQEKESVYDTDVFEPLLAYIEMLSKISYQNTDDRTKAAFRILADHARAASFTIVDGCVPSHEGRGYVLRKIIRRAALLAQQLGSELFFPQLIPVVVMAMKDAYPVLATEQDRIMAVVTQEVEKFAQNLAQGQALLKKYCEQKKDVKIVSGEQAFTLYDTYGFPLELTKLIADSLGFAVDVSGFEKYMELQRAQSGKKASDVSFDIGASILTEFTGYDEDETSTEINGLVFDAMVVKSISYGQRCWVITRKSPLYVESGGQVSDRGYILIGDTKAPVLALKKIGKAIAVEIVAPCDLSIGTKVVVVVDQERRHDTMRNHTATHMLQSALVSVLGKQVKQAGSFVASEYLRFDFTYDKSVSIEQLNKVEQIVTEKILENIPVTRSVMTLQEATTKGAVAFFGEKYNPESVRVISIAQFSSELCGGVHVQATGDIGSFKIIEFSSMAAGSRRIVAVTGRGALELYQKQSYIISSLCHDFKVQADGIINAVKKQSELLKIMTQYLRKTRTDLIRALVPQCVAQAENIKNISFSYVQLNDFSAQELRDAIHELVKNKPGMYVTVSANDGNVLFAVGVSPELSSTISLESLAQVLRQHGLKGGVSKTMLQGGGTALPADLKAIIMRWLQATLK